MRQLTYLVALDRHRHFARAAESCNVSQPALSAGISELERELGVAIIRRSRSFQGITPAGERLLDWARQALASLDGLRQEADLVRSVPGGHLVLGTVPSAVSVTTLLATELRRLVPNLTLEVSSLSAADILLGLKRHEIHLGVAYSHLAGASGCEAVPLYDERYMLISRDDELPETLSWQEVSLLPLCVFSPEMQHRRIIDAAFRDAGATPRVVLQSNAIEVLISQVHGGGVFSIMPASALPSRMRLAGMRAHQILPERLSQVSLLRRRADIQPPLTETAWKLMRDLDLGHLIGTPFWQAPS